MGLFYLSLLILYISLASPVGHRSKYWCREMVNYRRKTTREIFSPIVLLSKDQWIPRLLAEMCYTTTPLHSRSKPRQATGAGISNAMVGRPDFVGSIRYI